MKTIILPWPVSKLDDASLDIAATLNAVGNAVKAVPTENTDLVQRAVEGSVAIMQKIAAREDFAEKLESSARGAMRKPCAPFRRRSRSVRRGVCAQDDAQDAGGVGRTVHTFQPHAFVL